MPDLFEPNEPMDLGMNQDLLNKLEEVDRSDVELTPWETNFISSFLDNPRKLKKVSEKQEDVIKELWDKAHGR